MRMHLTVGNDEHNLRPYLSKLSVWAIAVGTSVGWGSLVVTSNSYLLKAGPLGSVSGLLIGMAVMLLLSYNFHYLTCTFPGAGGVYNFTKCVFGYDRAFLVSWFASLTYMSMLWANATSLPLFAKYFFGDIFKFGYLYTIFGYEVYLGEALLSIAAIIIVSILCIGTKKATAHIMTVLVMLFTVGILICFLAAIFGQKTNGSTPSPAFMPGEGKFSQIIGIAFISPWAFIGFESITHSSEEFSFKRSKTFKILVISVITTTLLYVFITLLSITAYPGKYGSWLEYISDLENIEGINGLPAFYAAHHYLGNAGTFILSASLLSLIITSLIGNIRVLCRLFYALAADDILPKGFTVINRQHVPYRAVMLVSGISVIMPFLGRTAIGWIVDITTVGATIIYGFVSAAAYKTAKSNRNKKYRVTGAVGFLIMIVFGIYLLLPGLFAGESLETETYFLIILWSIIGFIYFRFIIAKDHARRFGKALIVWIALLSLVVSMTMIWTARTEEKVTNDAIDSIREYYDQTDLKTISNTDEEEYISSVKNSIHGTNTKNTVIIIGLFTLALAVVLSNHFTMKRWEEKTKTERDAAREIAFRDPLTGVKSKNAYDGRIEKMNRLITDGKSDNFGIAVCDVNGLKFINDTYGHKAGDRYITDASALICEYFKHSPVYRIGGDEFCVIIEGYDYEHRETIIEQFNKTVESHLDSNMVVVSLGISLFDKEKDKDSQSVFERADALMYERKTQLKEMGAKTRD
ncbi:MAG: amino acid permease [Clostridia bacterium]|nr:amino acid permease [Clostridia bacterium]